MRLAGGNSIANVTSVTPGGAGVTQAFNVASLNGDHRSDDRHRLLGRAAARDDRLEHHLRDRHADLGLRLDAAARSSSRTLLRRREGEGAPNRRLRTPRGKRPSGRPSMRPETVPWSKACVDWISAELALTALAAMVSPTTLTFSVLVLGAGRASVPHGPLVLPGRARPRRWGSGWWRRSYIGDVAASSTPSSPKTWVAVVDVIAAAVLLVLGRRASLRRPRGPGADGEHDRADGEGHRRRRWWRFSAREPRSPNPGAFIPIALKNISELDPSAAQYIVNWVFFCGRLAAAARSRPSCCFSSRRDWTTAPAGIRAGLARAKRPDRSPR